MKQDLKDEENNDKYKKQVLLIYKNFSFLKDRYKSSRRIALEDICNEILKFVSINFLEEFQQLSIINK